MILFQDCAFNKLQSNSALRVSFQGNMRVHGSGSKCNRWYFKFNGNECSGPMTIEAAVYNYWPSGSSHNLLHHRSFEGYCENIPQGAVRVELWVGQCSGYTLGDAYTGWNSVSRIMMKKYLGPSPNQGTLAVALFHFPENSILEIKTVFFLVIFSFALCGYFRRIRFSIVNYNNSIKILFCFVNMLVLCSSCLFCYAALL